MAYHGDIFFLENKKVFPGIFSISYCLDAALGFQFGLFPGYFALVSLCGIIRDKADSGVHDIGQGSLPLPDHLLLDNRNNEKGYDQKQQHAGQKCDTENFIKEAEVFELNLLHGRYLHWIKKVNLKRILSRGQIRRGCSRSDV